MIVAGWADGYRNGTFRVLEALADRQVPRRLLAGPWAHGSLDTAIPGPRIDEVAEAMPWWDHWLRGEETGVDTGLDGAASVSAFVRTSTVPAPDLDTHEGFWIREEWPSPRVASETLPLTARPPYIVDGAVGIDAWIDCAGTMPWGLSGDLRHDDAASLTWDCDAEERTLLGQPVVRLRVSVDQPVAYLSAKLNDVFPDGTSALVTRGLLNLTHREGHAEPSPLVPGRVYDVEVELDACAYRYDGGQRLRLSLAGADWPNNAAPPVPLTLTVHGGELELPVWTGPSPYPAPTPTPPTEQPQPDGDAGDVEAGQDVVWRIERDVLGREVRVVLDYGSEYDGRHGSRVVEHNAGTVTVDQRDFRQTLRAESTYAITWPTTSVEVVSTFTLVADADAYTVAIDVTATQDGVVVATPRWRETIPRDLA